jgi:uncharacterized protein YndB with AHSA1/START domain
MSHDPGITRIGPSNDVDIRVERFFPASRERVWRALTDPELVVQWWAPNGSTLVVEVMDVRPGGRWRFVEQGTKGPDGFGGTYLEVAPPERLAFTFEWDGMPGLVTTETTTLEAMPGGGTRVVTIKRCPSPAVRDGMLHAGMEGAIARQHATLEQLLTHSSSTFPGAGQP